MNDLLTYFKEIPTESWHQVWLIVGSSAVVSVLLQGIKHWFSIGERKKLITGLLTLLSVLATVVDWLVQNVAQDALIFGRHTATIMGVAIILHRFFISPVYQKSVVQFKELLHDAQIERNRREAAEESKLAIRTQTPPQEFKL